MLLTDLWDYPISASEPSIQIDCPAHGWIERVFLDEKLSSKGRKRDGQSTFIGMQIAKSTLG